MNTHSSYPPLEASRRNLHVRWYRCPIDNHRLRELSKRSDRQGWTQAGGHLLLYLSLVLISVVFWFAQSWVLLFFAVWALGFVASFFSGTAPHELGHGTVFHTRRLNRFFLHLFSLISWWDPYDYASSHTYHHRFTTHPEADRENLLPIEPSLHWALLIQLLTINLFLKPGRNFGKGGILWTVYLTIDRALGNVPRHPEIPSQEWLTALHKDQPESFKLSVNWSRILLTFHASVFLVALFSGFWLLPLLISWPSFIAGIGSYFVGVTQHCGLRNNVADFRKNTRSIRLNPFLSFLYWHMNWHTEHHMYANVPCYNLPVLAKEIATDMPEPRTLYGAWIEMRTTWARQQRDPGYQYDTAVPKPIKAHQDQKISSLVDSIGDLAPDGLKDGSE